MLKLTFYGRLLPPRRPRAITAARTAVPSATALARLDLVAALEAAAVVGEAEVEAMATTAVAVAVLAVPGPEPGFEPVWGCVNIVPPTAMGQWSWRG